MSLNGDTIVMRNGRSTSQISVYNYPEHLNPFYDDDQHKRLRFWKINKNKKHEGWRGSLTSLRDMWAFKSFNLKKKSSTLGINKTSESPPQSPLLRRQFNGSDNTSAIFNTDDRRARYTIGTQGYNNNFERNQPYRSSLQNINNNEQKTTKGFGFNRNDQYRSTTQFAGFPSNNLKTTSTRLSQTSLASTNPFDSDDDCIEVNQSPVKNAAVQRKKRKAPAPPVRALKTENISPTNESWENTTLEIKENDDILNLTAEINNFVKISNEASGSTELLHERGNNVQPSKSTDTEQSVEKVVDEAHVLKGRRDSSLSKTNSETKNTAELIPLTVENITITETEQIKERRTNDERPTTTNPEVGRVESIRINIYGTSTRNSPEKTQQINITSFQKPPEPAATNQDTSKQEVTKNTYFTLAQPPKLVVETATNDVRRKSETRKVSFDQQVVVDKPTGSETRITETSNGAVPQSIGKDVATPLVISEESNAAITTTTMKPICSPRRKNSKQVEVVNTVNTENINQMPVANAIPSKTLAQQVPAARNSINKPPQILIHEGIYTKEFKPQNKPEVKIRTHEEDPNCLRSKETNQNKQEVRVSVYEAPKSVENGTRSKAINHNYFEDQPPAYEEQTIIRNDTTQAKAVNENGIENRTNVITTASNTQSNETVASPLEITETTVTSTIVTPTSTQHELPWVPPTIEFPPMRWQQTNFNASNTANDGNPTVSKRKSVKDIIESINKSQRLLNESASKGTSVYSTSLYSQNNNAAAADGTNILSHSTQDKATNLETANTYAECQNVAAQVDDVKQPNSGDSFKKHKINKVVCQYRESSPTSSNLDWNPLPKPKRTVNSANKQLSD